MLSADFNKGTASIAITNLRLPIKACLIDVINIRDGDCTWWLGN